MAFEDIQKHYMNTLGAESDKYNHPDIALSDKKMVICSAYYSIELLKSTANMGTLDIHEYIGSESPVKYHKILDLVIYGFTTEYKKKAQNDYIGFVYEKKGESLILPGIFEPMEGDFFISYIDNQAMLYMVTAAEELLDKDKTVWQISHEPYVSKEDPNYLAIEAQVTRTSKYISENIGTNKKTLIAIDEYNTLVTDINVISDIQIQYLKAYYKKDYNTYICDMLDNDNTKYYSPLLIEFLIRSNVLFNERLSVNMQLSHETLIPNNFELIYKNSIYGKHERYKPIGNEDLLFTKTKYKGEYMFSFFNKHGEMNVYVVDRDPTTISNIPIYGYDSMKDVYLKDLRKLIPTEPNSLWDNVIRDINDITKLKEYMNDIDIVANDIYAYMIIPLVLYTIKMGNRKVTADKYDDVISDLLGMNNY